MTTLRLAKRVAREQVKDLTIKPLILVVAKRLIGKNHYLGSFPGGTSLAFGIFLQDKLMGVATLGAGSANACNLVEGTSTSDCLTLSRFWLRDDLPANSASKVIGMVVKSLMRHTDLKFLITYADPSHGHVGIIYQATNWLYTGLSDPTPYYALEGGEPVHSRSFSQVFGTRSREHFSDLGMKLATVAQSRKHR